jgi:bacteriorhodopsin
MFEAVALQIDKAEPLARPESVWLALGTVLMLLGMVYFIAKGWGVEPPARHFYTITILIPAIAAASYLSMFLGFGVTEVTVGGETRAIYWARYADWLLTTPLLLLDLNLLAGADRDTIQTLAVLDIFMIGTGLVGALTQVEMFRYVWWTVSTIALLVILYFLFVNLTQKAEEFDPDRASTFKTLRNLTVVLWLVYPVLWLVGTEGAGLVNLYVETLGFMILDVTAKVGFGIILLRSRAIFGDFEGMPSASSGGDAEPTPAG